MWIATITSQFGGGSGSGPHNAVTRFNSATYHRKSWGLTDVRGTIRIVFSPDCKRIAATQINRRSIRITEGEGAGVWDIETRKLRFEIPGSRFLKNSLAFSPDGSLLAIGDDEGKLELWDVAELKRVTAMW